MGGAMAVGMRLAYLFDNFLVSTHPRGRPGIPGVLLTVSSGSVIGPRARAAWAGECGDSQLRRTYQTIVRRMGSETYE